MAVEPERIHVLAPRDVRRGDYVLYWMQASVRAHWNPALEHAIAEANRLEKPLLVCFGLTDTYPGANHRHYRFLAEGLAAARADLEARGIKLVVRRGPPAEIAADLGAAACSVVTDRGYLRHQRRWRRRLAAAVSAPVVEVEGDVVVPVALASDRREYAARTLRPKIHARLGRFLVPLPALSLDRPSLDVRAGGLAVEDPDALMEELGAVGAPVAPVSRHYRGGTAEARAALARFVAASLARYPSQQHRPASGEVSRLSMYLHYGHISPVYAALQIRGSGAGPAAIDAFLEQLVVRRELAFNFVTFEPRYDVYAALPRWARATLAEHRRDHRGHVYTRRELERGATHDRYWNAAMAEMRETGYLHNRMRMYWGKRILAWTRTPEHAFRTVAYLNDKYFLDGRDPNSYANVGWLFGLFDQPFPERAIFGKVRPMTARGLERKSDPDAYVAMVERRLRSAQD